MQCSVANDDIEQIWLDFSAMRHGLVHSGRPPFFNILTTNVPHYIEEPVNCFCFLLQIN